MSDSLRDRLRALPVFGDDSAEIDVDAVPTDPTDLIIDWLESALASGVDQPHAMTLATASGSGTPTARTLLLKDVTPEGLWFASLADSPKGRDIEANPRVAIVLYWREQGRQVRVTGTVTRGPVDVSAKDFLQRHPKARATVIAGAQSEPIGADHDALVEAALARVEAEPELVHPAWTAYVIRPETVEFWQAARHREQTRLSYQLDADGWHHNLLWP